MLLEHAVNFHPWRALPSVKFGGEGVLDVEGLEPAGGSGSRREARNPAGYGREPVDGRGGMLGEDTPKNSAQREGARRSAGRSSLLPSCVQSSVLQPGLRA